MVDRPLFTLDAEARWRLAYDQRQWIIQYRQTKRTATAFTKTGRTSLDDGWRSRSFVNGSKATLRRLFRELAILLTDDAIRRVDALPDTFRLFLVEYYPNPANRSILIQKAEEAA